MTVNREAANEQFAKLMKKTDALLNREAVKNKGYFSNRNGTALEEDVRDALEQAAKNTPFDGTIRLVSGSAFPDIVANHYYGVEVKSTNKNHWKSIGSSILESTRIPDIERIFLTFGKLGGDPAEFRSRPYEDCLCGISVTHYPRYQIDMELKKGGTIFDKMGTTYEELRKLDDPVVPVSKYYKKTLKPGESLWWANGSGIDETGTPPVVRLWTTLPRGEKEQLTVQGYALFPEVLGGDREKYGRYALWLTTQKGVVNTNIRDSFSAGGKVPMETSGGVVVMMPAAFGRIKGYCSLIKKTLTDADEETLKEYWKVRAVGENRLEQWCEIVADMASASDRETVRSVLWQIFPELKKKN